MGGKILLGAQIEKSTQVYLGGIPYCDLNWIPSFEPRLGTEVAEFRNEVEFLSRCENDTVLGYRGAFEDWRSYTLVTDLCSHGDLDALVYKSMSVLLLPSFSGLADPTL